jgi:hypothetical protein
MEDFVKAKGKEMGFRVSSPAFSPKESPGSSDGRTDERSK